MKHFEQLPFTIPFWALARELRDHPELWNQHKERKETPGTPHGEMSDIWVRYRPRDELKSPADYTGFHIPAWYPAARDLPDVVGTCHLLMTACKAVQLGGVLITKIPPGGRILPHHDRGTWHAEFFNHKVYVPIQSEEGCLNFCEDEHVWMREGEAWTFDNQKMHSVENGSHRDRITLIVCMRVER